MTWTDLVALAQRLPEVEEATSYGEPALKVRGKLLCRLRVEEDAAVLLGVPIEERAHLIEMAPDVFFKTPHYEDYNIVLARLGGFDAATASRILERKWRGLATKRAVKAFDAGGG